VTGRPTPPPLKAWLAEDGGRAASGTDFFRSAGFLAAEGTTHSLLILQPGEGPGPGGGHVVASAPLLVREIPGSDRSDAISPYGYPGMTIVDHPPEGPVLPIDPATIDFSATGLVSIFLRHSLDGPLPIAGATPRNICLLSDPSLPRKSRASDRQQIRKNLKLGFDLEITPGPKTTKAQRSGFLTAYTETMARTGAADRYFFSESYFEQILSAADTWLFLLRAPQGEPHPAGERPVAAASIAVLSDGLLHYYLSGTADAHLKGAPMKNVVEEMIGFAGERELALNLGGGITPGDALEEFKRGFANREEQWFTSEIICDPEASTALTAELAPDGDPGFFPPYRA